MTQKGTHTWDLYIHYHRCPNCGYIMESRQDFEKRANKYVKDLVCSRCQKPFSVLKEEKPTWGPLTGDPQPIDFEWDTKK